MTPRRLGATSGALLAVAVLLGAGVGTGTAAAGADSGGTPGYCPTDEGVTVVVDFQELGGGIVVRCAPGPVVPGYSGLDALQDAGFTPTGVRQYGLAFICRIADRPAADQTLPIQGDPDYREDCNQTPPQAAFWGYWYARDGGSWTYSQIAAINRDAIKGGFEGWSFSLNHAPGQLPRPGISPKRPPHAPPTTPPPTTTAPPTHRPPTHRPPTHDPPTHRQPTHRAPTHGSGGSSPHQGSTLSTPTPTATQPTQHAPGRGRGRDQPGSSGGGGPDPTSPTGSAPQTDPASTGNPVAVGHNSAGEKVSGELPGAASADHGSLASLAVAVGLVALLAAGGGVAAWRRRVDRG